MRIAWGQGAPLFLAVDGTNLYRADTEGDSATTGTIKIAIAP